jgi:hypothetical protein
MVGEMSPMDSAKIVGKPRALARKLWSGALRAVLVVVPVLAPGGRVRVSAIAISLLYESGPPTALLDYPFQVSPSTYR